MLIQKGQIILILILIITVVLAVVLSIVQKSLVDVSSSTRIEQSSRAFSAAEAGIEKALKGDKNLQSFPENNSSITQIFDSGFYPYTVPNTPQLPLEYPPLAKEDVAQVWLADPAATLPTCGAPNVCYTQNTLDVYWGNSSTDRAAIELTLVYHDGTQYKSRKWYLDHNSAIRTPPNGFNTVSCGGYTLITNTNYQCLLRLGIGSAGSFNEALPSGLMLIRARLLYNITSQPFAVQAVGSCASGCNIPPQARILFSQGASGDTQRAIQLFQEYQVVPPYYDYAIFSAGDITK